MMIATTVGEAIEQDVLIKYFDALVNRFYKMLPIREQRADTLPVYIHSFQRELLGCKSLIITIKNDPAYLSLLSILQSFVDDPELPKEDFRRDVFHAISICKSLSSQYAEK